MSDRRPCYATSWPFYLGGQLRHWCGECHCGWFRQFRTERLADMACEAHNGRAAEQLELYP